MIVGDVSWHVSGSRRQPATYLCADIKDYDRLLAIDEESTRARVNRHRHDIIDPTIAEHHGLIVKNKHDGDGFIAVFDSPLDAVRCAIVIRQSLVGRQQWIRYRLGVGLGNAPNNRDDIYGDGVSVAVQLQSLAEPGTVYISGDVHEQVKNELACAYRSLGDENLENVRHPVRVYEIIPDPSAAARALPSNWIIYAIATVVGVAAGVAGGVAMRGGSVTQVEAPPPPAVKTAQPARPAPQQQAAAVQVFPPALPPVVEPPAPPPAQQEPSQVAVTLVKPPRLPLQAASPYEVFRECEQCPEMINLPSGTFTMGGNDDPTEKPAHPVNVAAFALGRLPVTIGEWKQCVAAKACNYEPSGDDDMPVYNVSWNDAQQYVTWLSTITNSRYRLPTEAEWEYAARGGATTKYWWGDQVAAGMANCKGCGEASDPRLPMKAGSFAPNPFGLHDMAGGVTQWVSDCWHKNYVGAPKDSSAWDTPNCQERVLRGGSWRNDPSYSRASSRDRYDAGVRYQTHGLRVARSRAQSG
jgi:formylglycine-generating enzyme required for sulfatase activity/class 3 adenylate cyclase